jgi:hypothetical protein
MMNPGLGLAHMMLAGLVVLGAVTIIAHRARAQDVAVTYPAIGMPMMGMMSGGCPAMGWGGPMMMGVVSGAMPYGMMGWNNGYDGSTFVYHGMMGGNRVIQNSVIAGNAASTSMPPKGMGPQMMAGNAILAWPSQEAVIEGRLAFLRVALGITETQSSAWNTYADAVRNHAGRMQDTYQHHVDAMMQGDAISRIDARIQMMEAMLDAMKAIRPAIDQLYKALTSDQKQLANQLIGPDCNGM